MKKISSTAALFSLLLGVLATSSAGANDPATLDRINACLMKVTATSGLSATEQARRRVSCYYGTRGLSDECEGRVTATAGLLSSQENQLRSMCRSVSPS